MSEEQSPMPRPPRIPGWFIALAVMVTATITAWAVLRKRSTSQDWPGDPTTLPQRVTQVLSPALAATTDPALTPVAAVRQPLVIRAGAPAPHPDRGTCTLCHIIVDKVGAVVPAIRAMSSLPHAYRGGICTNCHQVNPSPAAAAAQPAMMAPVAGQGWARAAQPPPQPAWAPPALGTARPVREGAWLGMEVVPINAMTAAQYKLAAGQSGVVVAEAEGAAAAAGIRAGDVLIAFNGTPVVDMQSFLGATQGRSQGTIDVMRGGKILRGLVGQGATPASPSLPAAAALPATSPGNAPPVTPY